MKKKTALCLLSLAGILIACSGSSSFSVKGSPLPSIDPNITGEVDSGSDSGIDATIDAPIDTSDASADVSSPPPPPPCFSENDTQFCARYSSTCGSVVGTDNCNVSRTVLSCGNCKATEFCNSGVCTNIPCVPESDLTLCIQTGKTCGVLSAADNCGTIRTPNCGVCPAPTVCNVNLCCTPLSCGALNCGSMNDGCGGVLPCNNICPAGYSCTNNICVPPVCVPESDMAFCTRLARNCGTVSDIDNCGVPRTVLSCGSLAFSFKFPGINITDGVPAEFTNGNKYISAWINPAPAGGNIIQLGLTQGAGQFLFSLNSSKFLGIGGQFSTVSIPSDNWVFVFASIENGTGTVGKIVNDKITRETVKIDLIGSSLVAGELSFIGSFFSGRMNNVRFWSSVPNDVELLAHYHDCIPNQPGLIRQWCMREGSGGLTIDSNTGMYSPILDGGSWTTGTCF